MQEENSNCSVCGKSLPSYEFYTYTLPSGKTYKRSICKRCYLQRYYERRQKQKKQYKQLNPLRGFWTIWKDGGEEEKQKAIEKLKENGIIYLEHYKYGIIINKPEE